MEQVVLWLKFVHIATLVVWCAGLLALPPLLAAYPRTECGTAKMTLLRAKARFGYVAVISPAAVLAVISGTLLIWAAEARGGWLVLKLTAVAAMVVFHVVCGSLISKLHERPDMWRPAAHRALGIVPLAIVPLVLWLVLAKPL